MTADRRAVLLARQQRARALGLCGERFGFLGVCDEPAGHKPIAPPQWMHSAHVDGGPLGDLLEELRDDR